MGFSFCTILVSMLFLLGSVPAPAQLEPPTPRLGKRKSNPPQNQSKPTQERTTADQRGTEKSPVIIKVLPTTKTNEETANEQTDRKDISAANWWMVRLTGVISFIGFLQLSAFYWQARRLRQTIQKMDEIARGQNADMQASIGQATRAALAMERVAASMESNASSVRDSVGITREIADRQKLISELQSRAYLSVEFFGIVPQNTITGIRFEPRVAIINRGNTPAYKVKVSTCAEVAPFPLREDFPFTLTAIPQEGNGSGSIIASTMSKIIAAVVPTSHDDLEVARIKAGGDLRILMWGKVTYEDAFGIARFVDFGFTFSWLEDGVTVWSLDTKHHNNSN